LDELHLSLQHLDGGEDPWNGEDEV
jgi:hypothetical protein